MTAFLARIQCNYYLCKMFEIPYSQSYRALHTPSLSATPFLLPDTLCTPSPSVRRMSSRHHNSTCLFAAISYLDL